MGSKRNRKTVQEESKSEWSPTGGLAPEDLAIVAPPIESLVEEQKVVRATETPESVVQHLMSEEDKKAVIERLNVLKQTLNQLEEQKFSRNVEVLKKREEKQELTLDEIMIRVNVLQNINSELRSNIYTFAQSTHKDSYEETLKVLAATTKIYRDIVEKF